MVVREHAQTVRKLEAALEAHVMRHHPVDEQLLVVLPRVLIRAAQRQQGRGRGQGGEDAHRGAEGRRTCRTNHNEQALHQVETTVMLQTRELPTLIMC